MEAACAPAHIPELRPAGVCCRFQRTPGQNTQGDRPRSAHASTRTSPPLTAAGQHGTCHMHPGAPVLLAPEQRRLGLGLLAMALKAVRISVHFIVAAAVAATQRTRNTPEASPCSAKSPRIRKRWKCDLKFMFPYFKKLKVNRIQTSDEAAAAEGNFKEPCFYSGSLVGSVTYSS